MITAQEALEKTRETEKQLIAQALLVISHLIETQAASEVTRTVDYTIPTPAFGNKLAEILYTKGYAVFGYPTSLRISW